MSVLPAFWEDILRKKKENRIQRSEGSRVVEVVDLEMEMADALIRGNQFLFSEHIVSVAAKWLFESNS